MTRRLPGAPSAERALRRDAAANRQRILDAAGELLRTEPHNASMPRIARLAGVGTATAYRYFPTLDQLLSSYLHGVVTQLRDFSHDCPTTGAPLFDDVAREWLRLLEIYGPAMVQLRSPEGFLGRLHRQDPVISTVRDAWERPIRAVLRSLKVSDDYFEPALRLYNAVFDPREVLDLRDAGMTAGEAQARLTGAFKGAVKGWAEVGSVRGS